MAGHYVDPPTDLTREGIEPNPYTHTQTKEREARPQPIGDFTDNALCPRRCCVLFFVSGPSSEELHEIVRETLESAGVMAKIRVRTHNTTHNKQLTTRGMNE